MLRKRMPAWKRRLRMRIKKTFRAKQNLPDVQASLCRSRFYLQT